MSDVFAGLAERLAASRLGVDAVWTSRLGGPPLDVRVVPSRPEQAFGTLDGPRGAGIATQVMMTATALPGRPERGDLLSFGGEGFTVAEVLQDARGVSFTLHLRRA